MNTRKPTGEGTFSSNISGSAASASGSITVTDEFAQALSAIDQGRNVLISGRAGTGKSTLLRLFLERANQTVAGQPAKKVLITAPTGVAALNVGGFTIHKSFGFYVGLTPDALAAGKWKPAEAVRDVLQNMDLLVVDEISMVRADLFECMDLALRKVRGNPAPFGGVQLVLVGDLLQLPPVLTESERDAFLARWESPYFFAAESYDALDLVSIQLTHIWRQTDNEFIEILNQVREGSAGEEVLSLLNQQVDPNFEVPDDWVTLTATHRQVAKINKEHLEALGTPIHVSRASLSTDRLT